MRILVTGGSGFLGSHVARVLAAAGHEVSAASRRSGLDLRDAAGSAEFMTRLRPDLVVHCAAHVGGIAYNAANPIEIFEDNLRIGLGLVHAVARAGVRRLVNILPNCTYPGLKEVYREPEWWDGPIHPSVLTYGFSRKALWGLCWAYAQKREFEAIHLIFPNMYGPGEHFDPVRSHALGALISKIVQAHRRHDESVVIWGTGKPVREWLYVEDGAIAIHKAIERFDDILRLNESILNIGVGHGISITDMAEAVRGVVGWRGKFEYDTSKPDGAPVKLMDVGQMRAVLGWSPPTAFAEGVRKSVSWYLDHLPGTPAAR